METIRIRLIPKLQVLIFETFSLHKIFIPCKCFSEVNVKSDDVESNLSHNHPKNDDQWLVCQNLGNSLKRTALEDPSIRLSKLQCKELRKADTPWLKLSDFM